MPKYTDSQIDITMDFAKKKIDDIVRRKLNDHKDNTKRRALNVGETVKLRLDLEVVVNDQGMLINGYVMDDHDHKEFINEAYTGNR